VVGHEDDLTLALRQVDRDALEVEPLAGLTPNLVESVAQLLLVEVADDVEGNVSGHGPPCPMRASVALGTSAVPRGETQGYWVPVSAVRKRLQEQLADPVAPAAAHDEDGVTRTDLAGEPGGGLLHRARRPDRDRGVAAGHGRRELLRRGDRRIRIATGPDV